MWVLPFSNFSKFGMVSPILFLAPDVFVKNIALSLKKFNYNNDSNSVASCRVCQKTGNITQVLLQLPPQRKGWVRTGTPVDMQVTWAATARFRQQANWLGLSIYPVLAGGGVAWEGPGPLQIKGLSCRSQWSTLLPFVKGSWGLGVSEHLPPNTVQVAHFH